MKPRYRWKAKLFNRHFELGVWVLNDECYGKCGGPVSVFLDPPRIGIED